MRNFDFKKILKEEIYNFKYPHQDKIRIVLSEGQTLLIEKEIHEGIMDRMAGYSKEQPGWEKEMSNIIDQWLAQSGLSDEDKAKAKAKYMKEFEQLPPGEWDDPNPKAEKDIEDSLEAISKGDIKTASDKLKSAEEEWGDAPGFGDEGSSISDDFFKDDSESPGEKRSGNRSKRRSILRSEDKLINDLVSAIRDDPSVGSDIAVGPEVVDGLRAYLKNAGMSNVSDWMAVDVYKLIKRVVTNKGFKNLIRDLKESKNQQKILESVIIKCIEVYIKNENKKQLKS